LASKVLLDTEESAGLQETQALPEFRGFKESKAFKALMGRRVRKVSKVSKGLGSTSPILRIIEF
jgi:hypothetical protein